MCKAKKRTEKCQTKYRQIGGSALRQQRINGARRTQTLSRYATWSSMHVHSPAYTSMCYICVRVAVLNELSERTSRKHRRGCFTPGKNSDIEQQARAMSVRVCVCAHVARCNEFECGKALLRQLRNVLRVIGATLIHAAELVWQVKSQKTKCETQRSRKLCGVSGLQIARDVGSHSVYTILGRSRVV